MGKDWPWLLGVALFVGIALSVAAYALGSGTTTVTMLSVALIALGLAQVVNLFRGQSHHSDIDRLKLNQQDIAASVYKVSQIQHQSANEMQSLHLQIAEVNNAAIQFQGNMSEGMSELRQNYEGLAVGLKSILESQKTIEQKLDDAPVANQRQVALQQALIREQQWMTQLGVEAEQQSAMAEPLAPPPAQPALEEAPFGDALNLALEPIVDLYTSNTAHYRMVLGMTNEQGKDIAHDVFLHHADRVGLRDSLDVHVIEQTLALLSQLRQRDAGLSVFVPIGATTLANPKAVEKIIAQLRAVPEYAQGVIVDLSHAVLASLSETSLEGLATLARAGVSLSLSQASIAGIDLAALHRLNVRFVSLAASSIGVGSQISAGLPGFVQSARALRIQVIVSQVGDPRHVAGLARTARYASGPAFALPRKLKRALTDETTLHAAA